MMTTIPLGKVVDVSAGRPAPKPNEFSDRGHPFIRAGSLEGLLNGKTEQDCEKIDEPIAKRNGLKLYPKDTVLFAKSGMSAKLGRVYRLREPSYVVSHLAALSPTGKFDPSYLTHWLRSHPPSRLINDDSYPSIRISEIAGLEVPDIDLNEQRRIAAILDKADGILRKGDQLRLMLVGLVRSAFAEMFGDLVNNPRDWPTMPLVTLLDGSPQNGLYKPARDYGSGTRILRIDGFCDGYLEADSTFKRLNITSAEINKYSLKTK